MTQDAVSVGPTRGLYLILKDLQFSLYKKYSFIHFFHSGSRHVVMQVHYVPGSGLVLEIE